MMIVLRLVYGSYEWQICMQLLRFLTAIGFYWNWWYFNRIHHWAYVWVSDQSNIAMFWVKKLISQSTVPAESPFFEEMILAHYTLMPIFFWTPLTPPICLKMTKCAIFSTFWESHFKNTPKVGVHRENFNIGNLSQIFFGDFYTC